MFSSIPSAALSALLFSAVTSGAALTYCPDGDICFSVAVPEASASSGNGNIYFQLSGPSSNSWISLGTGSQMADSNMFVMYQDGNGNVTISPRQGTQHTMPTEDTSSTAAQLTLLEGSGVEGNTMTANVRCSNCQSWANGGEMSLSSSSSNWIAAWKSGSSLATTDKNAAIAQHDGTDAWGFDLTQASVATDANPFVAASSGGSGESGSGSGNNTESGSDSGSGTSNPGSSSSGVVVNTSLQELPRLVAAHGVIMSVTFVILYPLGSILMPLVGNWILHAAWQFVTFILMWVGFGIGVVASQRIPGLGFSVTHTVFGTVIVCLMVLQPALGYLHHMHYVKYQARGPVSYAHIIYGRVLMMLGVINGGLGLQLAQTPNNLVVAYAVVAAVMFVAYVGIKGFSSFKKRRSAGPVGGPLSKIPGSRKEAYSPQRDEMELPQRPSVQQR